MSGLVFCFESKIKGSIPYFPVLIHLLTWTINVLLILLTVAFFTLFERKVIGLIHLRVGPNKVSFWGLFQPLLDAFKLLSKQNLISTASNKTIYTFSPSLSLILSISFWLLIPSFSLFIANSYSILGFIFIGSLMVFSNLLAGWSSNSKYTFIGSLRSVAQSVSYEAVLTTLVIVVLVLRTRYSILSASLSLTFLSFLLLPLWLFSTLAETHRAPFDFAESERELVRGYNTEYGAANFAFVFLAEYSALLFSCRIIYYLFFSSCLNPFLFSLGTLFTSFIFIIIRVSYPRFRYDFLIILAWKSLLPITLCLLLISYFLV